MGSIGTARENGTENTVIPFSDLTRYDTMKVEDRIATRKTYKEYLVEQGINDRPRNQIAAIESLAPSGYRNQMNFYFPFGSDAAGMEKAVTEWAEQNNIPIGRYKDGDLKLSANITYTVGDTEGNITTKYFDVPVVTITVDKKELTERRNRLRAR